MSDRPLTGVSRSRYTFEATFEDGSPRRYVGMYRPPCPTLNGGEAALVAILQTGLAINIRPEELHARWLDGVLDRPLYAVEEDE